MDTINKYLCYRDRSLFLIQMIVISRYTTVYQQPIPLRVVTNRAAYDLVIQGPLQSIQLEGDRIYSLTIGGAEYFGINIVADNIDYPLASVVDFEELNNVTAITITDGFLLQRTCNPGYTVRQNYVLGNRIFEQGKSYIFDGCDCKGKFLAPY